MAEDNRQIGEHVVSDPLQLTLGWFGETPVVHVTGNLAYGEALQSLHDVVSRLAARGHNQIVMDLGKVEVTDSSGISALLDVNQVLGKHGAPTVLLHTSERLQTSLALMRVASIFELVDDESELVRRFGPRRVAQPSER